MNYPIKQLNPQHTCPTIDDGGFAVWESRAILQYLASKYDQSGTLYPEDLQIRTMINQKLFFDMELNAKVSDYFYPQIMGGAPADAAKLQKLLDFLGFLDTALDGKAYIVGDALTIADISLINTLSMLELLNIDFGQFQNIPAYMEKCKATTPGYDGIASKSLEAFAVFANKLN